MVCVLDRVYKREGEKWRRLQKVGVDWLNQLLLASFSSAYIGNPNKYVSRWADEEEVAHIVEVEPNDSQKKKLYDDE